MTENISGASSAIVINDQTFMTSATSLMIYSNAGIINGLTMCAVISSLKDINVGGASVAIVIDPPPNPPTTRVDIPFDYTNRSRKTYTVPAGIPAGTRLEVGLWGASGGAGHGFAEANTLTTAGGNYVYASFAVLAGMEFALEIGERGAGGYGPAGVGGDGGWPDYINGTYDHQHEAAQGGQGGSTRLYLDGELVAEAGGSPGTRGYAEGLSMIPSDVTYITTVNTVQRVARIAATVDPAGSEFMMNHDSNAGRGVLNRKPSGTARSGNNGQAHLVLVTLD